MPHPLLIPAHELEAVAGSLETSASLMQTLEHQHQLCVFVFYDFSRFIITIFKNGAFLSTFYCFDKALFHHVGS